jgi:hypothetical protein
MQLPEKYKENFDFWSEGPSFGVTVISSGVTVTPDEGPPVTQDEGPSRAVCRSSGIFCRSQKLRQKLWQTKL